MTDLWVGGIGEIDVSVKTKMNEVAVNVVSVRRVRRRRRYADQG